MESTDFWCPRSMWVAEPDRRSRRCTRDSPHATATRQCCVATDDMSWQKTKLLILKSFTVYNNKTSTVATVQWLPAWLSSSTLVLINVVTLGCMVQR